MYDEQSEWVVYHPPKSAAFGHQARIRDARIAWETCRKFLDLFTTCKLIPRPVLECWGPNEWTESSVADARIGAARDLFGPERDATHALRAWDLTEERLPAAIDLALDDDKWPKQKRGPVHLHFGYSFVWRALGEQAAVTFGGPEEGGRKRASRLGVHLGGRQVFLQPSFVFPFAWDSSQLRDFLATIEESAPFRFRDQYFNRWLVPKSGGRGRSLKLGKGWREPTRPILPRQSPPR